MNRGTLTKHMSGLTHFSRCVHSCVRVFFHFPFAVFYSSLVIASGAARSMTNDRPQLENGKWKSVAGSELRLVIKSEFDQRVAPFQVELLANVGAVVFDGAMADEEFGADLLAGLVLGNQLEDAPLGGGEVLEAGFLFDEFGRARVAVNEE